MVATELIFKSNMQHGPLENTRKPEEKKKKQGKLTPVQATNVTEFLMQHIQWKHPQSITETEKGVWKASAFK